MIPKKFSFFWKSKVVPLECTSCVLSPIPFIVVIDTYEYSKGSCTKT